MLKKKCLPAVFLLILLLISCIAAQAESVDYYRQFWGCPACGHPGNTGLYCQSCGSQRPNANVQPSAVPAQNRSAIWSCPRCGMEGNSSNYCPNCGAARPQNSMTAAPRRPSASGSALTATAAPLSSLPGFSYTTVSSFRAACMESMNSAFPYRMSKLPIAFNVREAIQFGNALLRGDVTGQFAAVSGNWNIEVFYDTQTSAYQGTLSSIRSGYAGYSVDTIFIGREGLSYQFYYTDGSVSYLNVVVSQSSDIADYFTIRYEAPYTEFTYLSSSYYNGDREAMRCTRAAAAQNTVVLQPASATYDLSTGLWFE